MVSAFSGHHPACAADRAQHLDAIWRTAQRLGVPPSDVDDVAQEVALVDAAKATRYLAAAPLRSSLDRQSEPEIVG